MPTEDLAPTSDISVEFTPNGGGANYDKVDEDYASQASGSGEEVGAEYYESATDEYGVADTVSMGAGDITTQIEILAFVGWDDSGYIGSFDARLYIDGGYETSAEGDVEVPVEYPGSWLTRTFVGVWSKAEVDAAQAEVTCTGDSQSGKEFISTVVVRVTYESSVTSEQEGFLWRNDDGDEVNATSIENQDVDASIAKETNIRPRFLINTTGDLDSSAMQIEVKKNGDADSEYRIIN